MLKFNTASFVLTFHLPPLSKILQGGCRQNKLMCQAFRDNLHAYFQNFLPVLLH